MVTFGSKKRDFTNELFGNLPCSFSTDSKYGEDSVSKCFSFIDKNDLCFDIVWYMHSSATILEPITVEWITLLNLLRNLRPWQPWGWYGTYLSSPPPGIVFANLWSETNYFSYSTSHPHQLLSNFHNRITISQMFVLFMSLVNFRVHRLTCNWENLNFQL